MPDNLNLKVTAKRRIRKYADGADPSVDAPFETLEKEDTYTGQDAINVLNQMGSDMPQGGNA